MTTPPSKNPILEVLLSGFISCVALIAIGWFFGARETAYGIFLSIATIAFFPILLVVIGITIPILCAVLTVLTLLGLSDTVLEIPDTSDLVEAGVKSYRPWYRGLSDLRHPLVDGTVGGLLIGAGCLLLLFNHLVLRPEKATVKNLVEAKFLLEKQYEQDSTFPDPLENGTITWEMMGAQNKVGVVEDGFGRPVVYTKTGAWKLAKWEIRSLGYDGKSSTGDDLALSGATRVARLAGLLGVDQFKADPSHTDLVKVVKALRGNRNETDANE